MSLELIEWLDSCGCSSTWSKLQDRREDRIAEPLHCFSVGFVIHENDWLVVVAPHVSEPDGDYHDQQFCGDMTIPKQAIVGRRKLGEPKMPKGSKVHKVYEAVRKTGKSKASAAKIAQAATGKALSTGRKPKKK